MGILTIKFFTTSFNCSQIDNHHTRTNVVYFDGGQNRTDLICWLLEDNDFHLFLSQQLDFSNMVVMIQIVGKVQKKCIKGNED